MGAGVLQAVALVAALALAYRPLGNWMARVYTDGRHWRVERLLYRLFRVDPDGTQRWGTYAAGVLGFSFVSVVLLYLLQRLQPLLPLGFGRGSVDPATAFNTAVSFVTNTNWQSYAPSRCWAARSRWPG
jgi:potassium-transporting ATPase potassium-binding subunit